jgi:hypothetical protein
MNYTIRNSSGGNHGHQLKDWMGSYTIGTLLGLNYYHYDHKYLNFFLPKSYFKNVVSDLQKNNYIEIKGPTWDGINNYNEFKNRFKDVKINQNDVYVFQNAMRVHPFQTIDWFQKKYINENIFEKVCKELGNAFYFDKERKQTNDILNVCVHVNMHRNTGHTSADPRFKFSIDYYHAIIRQLEKTSKKELDINIYAEETNSDIIREAFADKKFKLHIGKNREVHRKSRDFTYIHSIFKDFVDSDILVCSNSSFSVVATYFRILESNKITIYHPHAHLNNLGDYKNCIPTDSAGNFKTEKLNTFIRDIFGNKY